MPQAPTRVPLSVEAQHVLDSLEAHANSIIAAARNQSPALVAEVAKFSDAALAKLEAWGLTLRGKLQSLENADGAAPGVDTEASKTGSAEAATAAAPGAAPAGVAGAFAGAATAAAAPTSAG